mgnify:CR=1 FL=1
MKKKLKSQLGFLRLGKVSAKQNKAINLRNMMRKPKKVKKFNGKLDLTNSRTYLTWLSSEKEGLKELPT